MRFKGGGSGPLLDDVSNPGSDLTTRVEQRPHPRNRHPVLPTSRQQDHGSAQADRIAQRGWTLTLIRSSAGHSVGGAS
jgi:hypothetical protein